MRQTALKTVHQLAKIHDHVVFVGSDLGAGTLKEMKEEFPDRFFMEGISEQHIVGFAAGLAKEGFVPYLNTIATFFTRRAYEQIAIDIALHNLPVRILASGGGIVYAPLGPTHTAIEDLSLMLSIPNLKVFAPADANEMRNLLNYSVEDKSPWYVRFGKGGEDLVTPETQIEPWLPKIFKAGDSRNIAITTGVTLQVALRAAEELPELELSVVHIPYLNDIALDHWRDLALNSEQILVVEEHVPRGGLLTQVLHEFNQARINIEKVGQISLQHQFSHNYGSQEDHFKHNSITVDGIMQAFFEKHKSRRG
jgi:transketolase